MNATKAVVFHLDGQRFALPAGAVERVVHAVEITPLPAGPPLVLGVIDEAGRVLPVLDLRGRMELPPRAVGPRDQLVLVDTGRRTVVLPVDEVDDVVEIDAAALRGGELAADSRAPLRGLLQLADGLVWLPDIERLFSAGEAEAFDRALAEATAQS